MRGQKVYKQVLDSLMSSVDRLEPGNEYECDRVYTDAEKRRVTPGELICWLNIPTFGDPDPAPDLVIKPGMRNNRLYYNILQYIVTNILYWSVQQ